MSTPCLIRLDLHRLRANLATAGDELTLDQVRDWLRGHGMIERGEWWVCEEIHARLFGRGEVIEAKAWRG